MTDIIQLQFDQVVGSQLTELVYWVRLGMLAVAGAAVVFAIRHLVAAVLITRQVYRFAKTASKFDTGVEIAGWLFKVADEFLLPKISKQKKETKPDAARIDTGPK